MTNVNVDALLDRDAVGRAVDAMVEVLGEGIDDWDLVITSDFENEVKRLKPPIAKRFVQGSGYGCVMGITIRSEDGRSVVVIDAEVFMKDADPRDEVFGTRGSMWGCW
jgi:hypothetical protein